MNSRHIALLIIALLILGFGSFYVPYVDLFAKYGVGVVLVILFIKKRRQGIVLLSDEDLEDPSNAMPPMNPVELQRELIQLRISDPDFSMVLFMDFARLVYSHFHELHRGRSGSPEELKPFLSQDIYEALLEQRDELGEAEVSITNVIIGGATLISLEHGLLLTAIHLRMLVGFTLNSKETHERRVYHAEETVTFKRKSGVVSKPPEQMRSLHCPSCGSPVKTNEKGLCASCGGAPVPGEEQWRLDAIVTSAEREVTSSPDENPRERVEIKDAKALRAPDLHEAMRSLVARDLSFDLNEFRKQMTSRFLELQAAWSAGDLSPLRPRMTDGLYQTTSFWIDDYRQRGLKNILKDVEVHEVAPIKVDSDAFYDVFTVLISASAKAYTVDNAGNVLFGSPSASTHYREYWTFIRRLASLEKPISLNCPNCSAELKEAIAQDCPYCGAFIEGAQFDWTAAFIDQEGAYRG